MTLIPSAMLTTWRNRARRGALELLDTLCEFREMVPDFKAEAVLMEAYGELAQSIMMAPETARDLMGKLREYPKEQVVEWFNQGLSWDHLEKANTLAELAHKPPAQLLDEAVNPGNATGDTMTVRELISHALGEVDQPMKPIVYRRTIIFKGLWKFPTDGWEDDKIARFQEWREAGREFVS